MIKFLFLIILFFIITSSSAQEEKVSANFHLQNYLKENGNSETMVGLFVKGNKHEIISFTKINQGLYRGNVKGWHYLRIPSNKITSLLSFKGVSEINFRNYHGQAMNDTMRVNNRINDIHAGTTPLDVPYTGDGVILGFIDTGIDWLHPDFMNPDSSTRILAIWDQTLTINQYTPVNYGYGQHWDSTLINQNIPTNNDQWGHGSTVAGAAAGNAFANGKNKGVAPKADIIMVESNFNAADWLSTVVDAVEYIYQIADSLGKPCSINASVGTYLGSHDGLDPYALYIDSLILSKRGHLLTASAGNSGDLGSYHLHRNVAQDTTYTFFEINPSAATGGADVFLEFWADSANFNQVNFTMGADKISPSHSFRGRGNFITIEGRLNSLSYDTIRNTNNDILATIQYWMEPRDAQYLIQVYMPQPDSNQYIFRMETFGQGSFDGWNSSVFGYSDMIEDPTNIIGFSDFLHYIKPDSLQTIVSSFQCSPNVLTVGNYSNDSGYVNKLGNWYPAPGEIRGQIASTSSIGPARTGIMKPEVIASGTVTNSSYPLFLIDYFVANNKDSVLALGGMHYRNGGTSMSSPIVAGVGALFLEKCPTATQADFTKAIINNTYSDGFTGSLPNYAYGYGKLDGFATLVDAHYTAIYEGDLLLCEGDSNLITITDTNCIYNWSNGETTASIYLKDSTIVTAFTIHNSGCISDSIILLPSISIKPSISTSSPYYYCATDSVSIELTGNFTTINYSDTNSENPRVFTTPFNGWVIAYDNNNCKSDTTPLNIVENPKPQASIVINQDTLSVLGGEINYQWYLNGNPISGANDSSYQVVANGNYYVEITNSYSCTGNSDTLLFENVGIEGIKINNISVYPNPSDGNLYVSTTLPSTVTLYSSIGEMIASEQPTNKSCSFKDLPSGNYFLIISNGKEFDIRKIIVLK